MEMIGNCVVGYYYYGCAFHLTLLSSYYSPHHHHHWSMQNGFASQNFDQLSFFYPAFGDLESELVELKVGS
jgi:hypothetical protein